MAIADNPLSHAINKIGDEIYLRDLPKAQESARSILDRRLAFVKDRIESGSRSRFVKRMIAKPGLSFAEQRMTAAVLNKSRYLGSKALTRMERGLREALLAYLQGLAERTFINTLDRTAKAMNAETPDGVTVNFNRKRIPKGLLAMSRRILVESAPLQWHIGRIVAGLGGNVRAKMVARIHTNPSLSSAMFDATRDIEGLFGTMGKKVDGLVRQVIGAADLFAQQEIARAEIIEE